MSGNTPLPTVGLLTPSLREHTRGVCQNQVRALPHFTSDPEVNPMKNDFSEETSRTRGQLRHVGAKIPRVKRNPGGENARVRVLQPMAIDRSRTNESTQLIRRRRQCKLARAIMGSKLLSCAGRLCGKLKQCSKLRALLWYPLNY